jgi:hypothetical protein
MEARRPRRGVLDALKGGPATDGVIRLSILTDAMENEVQSLTKGRQDLGMHINFIHDLFMEFQPRLVYGRSPDRPLQGWAL